MTQIGGTDLTSIVSAMAELKAENERVLKENEQLRTARTYNQLADHVVRFFLDVISKGTYDNRQGHWVFMVSDVAFLACNDWEVRQAISQLLAETTKKAGKHERDPFGFGTRENEVK